MPLATSEPDLPPDVVRVRSTSSSFPKTPHPNASFVHLNNPSLHPRGGGGGGGASGESTPLSESGLSMSAASDSEGSLPDQRITTTVTTTVADKESSTTEVTHWGTKGVTHKVDSNGSVHLRPVVSASKKHKKVKVTFAPRHSHFDRYNSASGKDPFRGFYTLFWIAIFLAMLSTFSTTYQQTGHILTLRFATLFSKDGKTLALSDAVMVGSMFICVPFAKLLKKGWIRYYSTGIVIQHVYQTAFLLTAIRFTFYRKWPWVQSGFFTLHSLCMLMKIHSYTATNGYLSDLYLRRTALEKKLKARLTELYGAGEQAMEKAMAAALEARPKPTDNEDDGEGPSAVGGGEEGRASSNDVGDSATRLRRRSGPGSAPANTLAATQGPVGGSVSTSDVSPAPARNPHPLSFHLDHDVGKIAKEVEQLDEELTSVGFDGAKSRVTYPDNLTFYNFADYLLIPTLVYDLEYPRTQSIRPLYVMEKTLATFGTFSVIYIITERWIIPHQPGPDSPFLKTFVELALPMMANYLLIFYIIFECICNAFAEITYFADREFYQDWWNSTSMDQFSRRWNKPVHTFLLRHVYASTISAYKLSKSTAIFLTFLLSALVHELVMAIVSGKVRMYLFSMQMLQLPLIMLGQLPFIRNNEVLGNTIFWCGLLTGFPLLAIAYLQY